MPTQGSSENPAADNTGIFTEPTSALAQGEEGQNGPGASRSVSSSQQRNGYPNGSRNRPLKPRRHQARDEDSLARDAMVDRILQESEVPLYDRPSSAAQDASESGIDADEAAAQAFKAEFLANLEEQKRRKPPPPPANSRAAPAAPTGPKLGGSRSQREKMRALEEAKNVSKSTTKK